MSIYMGRDAEFKAIYEHLKAAERILDSMRCFKGDDVDYKEIRSQIETIARNFDKNHQDAEEAWRQVYDKVLSCYVYNASKRKEIEELVERCENIVFFTKGDLDNIIAKYFNHCSLKAYKAMDEDALFHVIRDDGDGRLALYLDTMKICQKGRVLRYVNDRKKFATFLITDPEAIKVLGYKEKTVERIRKLMKLD